ncbi:MAG: SIR2 family protein [Lewinellaceae bacterium]|nr:SIR2 family protein [Lewinellaceae bacterium]
MKVLKEICQNAWRLEFHEYCFKESDYLNYQTNWPLTSNLIKYIFTTKVVLFIGFSFTDDNLKRILNWAVEKLGKDFRRAYIFSQIIRIQLN